MMDSLEQLSNINLEVMDVETDSINTNVININRNKIEAIPKTHQVQKNNKLKINFMNNTHYMDMFCSLKNCKI